MKKILLAIGVATLLHANIFSMALSPSAKQAAIKRELRKDNPDFGKLDAMIATLPAGDKSKAFFTKETDKKKTALRSRSIEQVKAEEQRALVQESIKKEEEPERKQARSEFNTLLDNFEKTVIEQEKRVVQSADPEVFYQARFDTIPVAGVKVQKARDADLADPTRIQARPEDVDRWALITQRGNNLQWKLLDKAQKAVDDLVTYAKKHPGKQDATFNTLNQKAADELSDLYTKIIEKIAAMGPRSGQAPIELFEVLLAIGDPEGESGALAKAYSNANDGLPLSLPDIPRSIAKIKENGGLEYLREQVKKKVK